MNPILQIIGYVKVICGSPHYCADLPIVEQSHKYALYDPYFLILTGQWRF